MQKSLFTKYFTACAAMIIVSITVLGALFLAFAAQYFKLDRQNTLERNVQHAVTLTQQSVIQDNGQDKLDSSIMAPGFSILSKATDADIFFVNTKGQTLYCTQQADCPHTTYLIPESVMNQVKNGQEFSELGNLGGIYESQYYTVGLPVVIDGTYIGAVFSSSSADSLAVFLTEMLKMFVVSACAVLLLSCVIIYFITRNMVKPLRVMAKAAQDFGKGDFSKRVQVSQFDEMGQLAIAFNNMANSLSTLESMRRSFIANVSHELKTPMTTISGFIDGILDGTIPEDKRDHYLKIVSQEVKRLSRLVRSMLNIARIEAGEMKISPIRFDLNETILNVLFTFEQRIEEKQLEVRGLSTEKFYVEADPDLIHQVIYNLVENAVKFVNDGGYLEFTYNDDGHKVFVSIKNSGQGISKEEIAHIFDRFYKSDKSRSLDKTGVGLGLYIVKSIINLHSGDIMVRSTEGEYAEFAFTLPSAKPERASLRRSRDIEKEPEIPVGSKSRKQEETPSLPEGDDHPDSGVC